MMRNSFIFSLYLAAGRSVAEEKTVTVKLNNGVEMPVLAFAAQVWPADTCSSATTAALDAGFRFVWSSTLIGTECQSAQGQAINASGLSRAELFVAGTVDSSSCQDKGSCYDETLSSAKGQFDTLGLDQLDMLMLDYPAYSGCDAILGQWQAFEELYAAGRVRTIAVSNFDETQLQCITAAANTSLTVPSVNMLRFSVGDGSSTTVADNAKYGIVVQAYSPLGSGQLIHDALCESIGEAHNKTAAQVALKWILQRNVTVATQSTSLSHLQEDMDLFDFTLSSNELEQLDKHTLSKRGMALSV